MQRGVRTVGQGGDHLSIVARELSHDYVISTGGPRDGSTGPVIEHNPI